jgi:Putative zinc-finger
MDHQSASELFSSFIDGELAGAAKEDLEHHLAACIQCRTDLEEFRRAVVGLGSLKRAAPTKFLPQIQKQIFVRSRGRFFGARWKLFGRIPFEWVSLAMIIAMLVYYIVQLHRAPTGVKPVGALPKSSLMHARAHARAACPGQTPRLHAWIPRILTLPPPVASSVRPLDRVREDHLQILALREPGWQRMIRSGTSRIDDTDPAAGLLRARGDDTFELGGVDVLRT